MDWKQTAGFLEIAKEREPEKKGLDTENVDWRICSFLMMKEKFNVRLYRRRAQSSQNFIYELYEDTPAEEGWVESMSPPLSLEFGYGYANENDKKVLIGRMWANGKFSYVIRRLEE